MWNLSARGRLLVGQVLIVLSLLVAQVGNAIVVPLFATVSPLAVMVPQNVSGSLGLVVQAGVRGKLRIRGLSRVTKVLGVAMGLSNATAGAAGFLALKRIPLGSQASIVLGVGAVLYAAIIMVVRARGLRFRDMACVLSAFGGIVLVCDPSLKGISLIGVLLALVGAACLPTYRYLQSRAVELRCADEVIALGSVVTTVLVTVIVVGWQGVQWMSFQVIGLGALSGVLTGFVPASLNLVAKRWGKVPEQRFGILACAEAAAAVLVGWPMLGQRPSIWAAPGVAFIGAAIFGMKDAATQAGPSGPADTDGTGV